MAPARRPPSHSAIEEAAGMLRRFIQAVEAGELAATTPPDVAVVRRLQGALVALELAGAGRGTRGREDGGPAAPVLG